MYYKIFIHTSEVTSIPPQVQMNLMTWRPKVCMVRQRSSSVDSCLISSTNPNIVFTTCDMTLLRPRYQCVLDTKKQLWTTRHELQRWE